MNNEIDEILSYLSRRDDYIIWAGLARHIHLGFPYSSDVDIFTGTKHSQQTIANDMRQIGWKIVEKTDIKLIKNDFTFDDIFSRTTYNLMEQDVCIFTVNGYNLRFVSKEWLFVLCFAQMTQIDRAYQKIKRDIEAIQILRKVIDVGKVKSIIRKLPDSYWLNGWV